MASLDQRIIDCIVADDSEQLGELSRQNGGETAVRKRAAALGLTKEVIKQCRLSGTPARARVCLKCDTRFVSWGLHNRLCRRCSSK